MSAFYAGCGDMISLSAVCQIQSMDKPWWMLGVASVLGMALVACVTSSD